MFVRFGTFSFLAGLALFASGCTDDSLPMGGNPTLGCVQLCGQTLLADSGEAVGSVRLALLRLDDLVITAVQTTDARGNFAFEGVPAGDYVPLVYDQVYDLARLPFPSFRLVDGDTMTVAIPLIERDPIAPGNSVRGRVIDATTGDPIVGAMADIASTVANFRPPFLEITGRTGSANQATDQNGYFEVGPVLCLGVPGGQSGTTAGLLIRKRGYQSMKVAGFDCSSLGADTLTFALQPGFDPFQLRGRLLDLMGTPLAGIEVGIEWVSEFDIGFPSPPTGAGKAVLGPGADALPKVILQGSVAVSDADGNFVFDSVPEGLFKIFPGYRLDDGWERVDLSQPGPGWSEPEGRVDAANLDVGSLAVAHMSRPIFPPEAGQPDSVSTLTWQSVPWASRYALGIERLDCDADCLWQRDGLAQPSATLNEPLPPGDYLWSVSGYLPAMVEEGPRQTRTLFERVATFGIPAPVANSQPK